MASTELENRPSTGVDPHDEPSAEWGWHGGFPKATQFAGWFSVFACLIMLYGNHQGIFSGGDGFKTADYWLIGIALALAIGLVHDLRKRRTAWRH